MARVAVVEDALHQLAEEQPALLLAYDAAARKAGARARALHMNARMTLFDQDLFARVQVAPDWTLECANFFKIVISPAQLYTALRNAYRSGLLGN